MKILVTGGAGFIGSAVIRYIIGHTEDSVINVDKLTYAGNLESLSDIDSNDRYTFCQVDICDKTSLQAVFEEHKPNAVMHLAAESHVDRSIDTPGDFIQTNIVGTYTLLDICVRYLSSMSLQERESFRFHHISTDEVYGDLDDNGLFTETTPYSPSSPYSASKAGSDHLVRAWQRTFGLPIVITNCSNNYGPYHFPEKLIPHVILSAIHGKPIPIYGDGTQIRDWLYVDDHAQALHLVLNKGGNGQTYNIGGHNEKYNIEVVETICDLLNELMPQKPDGINNYRELITFVDDRPGHDRRYAIDASKIQHDLGWTPQQTFESGIRKTVEWYLTNAHWWQGVLDGSYKMTRLGSKKVNMQ